MLLAQKCKHVHKTLQEKCQALKDIEKGLPNKDVATKYGVPKNIISTWIKNKNKILSSLEKGQNAKRRKLRAGAHETLDAAVFKWFLNMRSQNVPLSAGIIQEKASIYAKELNMENFKASDGWLRHSMVDRRSEEISHSKQFLENQIPYHLKWLMLGKKPHYQLYCPTMN